MADNLHPDSVPLLALPDHAVVSLEGPDATSFAHAQFANDVAALPVGHWQWNTWLTPKGRVIALFALARRDDQSLWLVLPDYPAEAFVSQLQRFVFRRKLKIAARPELHIAGAISASPRANDSRLGVDGEAIEFDLSAEGAARHWRISTECMPGSESAIQAWQSIDLQHGLPRLPEGQREQWTPQQLSLDRLQAYSVKKGCYPGQEIVARTHFLGKAKRGLQLLQGEQPLQAGGKVEADGVDAGELISTAGAAGTLALAVMPLETTARSLSSAGIALTPLPLLPGLAR